MDKWLNSWKNKTDNKAVCIALPVRTTYYG